MPRGRLGQLSAVAFGAALAALALPPQSLWPLGWFGLAPLFLAASSERRRDAALAGFAAGFAYHAVVLHWIYQTCRFARMPVLAAALAWFALSGFLALNWALTAVLGRRLSVRAPRALRPWLWALAWTAVAAASERWTPRLAADLFAYTQGPNLALLQSLSWGGPHLLGFVVVLFSASLAEARLDASAGEWGPSVRPLCASVLLAAGLWAHGRSVLLGRPLTPGPTARVEILQPKVDQYHKWDRAFIDAILANLDGLLSAPRPKKPALVVWPETCLPRWIARGQAAAEGARWAKALGAPQLVGIIAGPDGKRGGPANGAQFIASDGRVAGFYAKRELVPFGEFVPLRGLIPRFIIEHWLAVLDEFGDMAAGAKDQPLFDTPFGPAAVTICYEAMFPRWSRRDAARGARLLVNITNDGWYKDTWGPYQHFAVNAARAIESRMTVIRSGNTGISAVIDPYGRVIARLDLDARGRLDVDVPMTDAFPERSFYVRHGDWFGTLCMALLVLAALLKALLRG
ncbi:MAG TPA: apolipoprotein N-acyltransferase [Elusimicrobia bacterium]|nr:MAG: apolipoprotein N-acyltransferase [Elusimicrobia bacterium GWA2_66_18]OGR68310.1 MAG: apolipoprotein N-acyltransferase [Elusimicrobia bacterium GWC2_65_9]HAZ09058.1 apolipoprotein N-acyltransferase [Elusimicrobiota bacterium]